MIYVIDTNLLVSANRHDFPLDSMPDFWNHLVQLGTQGNVIIPEAVYEEIGKGNDELPGWLAKHKSVFYKPTAAAIHLIGQVANAYGPGVTEKQLEILQADPYVIAHALTCGATVVSDEAQSNATALHNIKIPTVCSALSVNYMRFPRFVWETR